MNINFDWNTMNGGNNPFETKTTYEQDTRFYTLPKDQDGNGAAVIRFLPSEILENGKMETIKAVYKYNIRSKDPTSKRFLSEWSPSTIGEKCPIQEKWAELWNRGQKDEARRYARSTRYIANIKVLNDTKNPENNGKIFLLDMSQTLAEKINSIIQPNPQEISLGVKPKNLFNPMAGHNFNLISQKGTNGFINYDKSVASEEVTAIYSSVEEAVNEINEKCYKLSDFDKKESYKSYDELKRLLDELDNTAPAAPTVPTMDAPVISTAQVAPAVQQVQPATFPQNVQNAQTAPSQAVSQTSQNLDALIAKLN